MRPLLFRLPLLVVAWIEVESTKGKKGKGYGYDPRKGNQTKNKKSKGPEEWREASGS